MSPQSHRIVAEILADIDRRIAIIEESVASGCQQPDHAMALQVCQRVLEVLRRDTAERYARRSVMRSL